MVTGDQRPRYAAFISYSHKDAAAARKLHARLERYRIPKRLVDTPGEHGPVPARLTPIFRDRDELPAAGDLSEQVRAALAASQSLIVICSPNSATSIWVAREIAAFRELNPGRPILAAVIAGEPGECFPTGLGGLDTHGAPVEPLAADLRKAGDGQRLGFLKLLAGLAGVGLDALIQRDAARAIRRVTAVTLTALAATLVMAVLTVIALNARHEADRQRAEAEGLVEFMLTDLRTKLKGIGRLEVLGIVNKRALDYYGDRSALSHLNDDSLERRSRILHAMGEDEVALGNMDTALLRFREAHAATGAILTRRPNDPKAIFAHGQSDYWVGRVHELRGEWSETGRYYAAYARSGRRLIAIDPANPSYMMECGWGELNLGIVALRGKKNAATASSHFRAAINWFAKVEQAHPRDVSAMTELAKSNAWLADSLMVGKRLRESLAARQEQRRISEYLLTMDPKNASRAFDLANAERALGRTTTVSGNAEQGQTIAWQAFDRITALAARDPRNSEWQLLRAMIACDLLGRASNRQREVLRAAVIEIHASFRAARNPRLSEIEVCISH